MIQGRFGDDDELFFEIELIAADGLELPIEALLDTGFSDWLTINSQDLEGLDWIYVRKQTLRTASGEAEFDIYVGKVRIDGQYFDIPFWGKCAILHTYHQSVRSHTTFFPGTRVVESDRLLYTIPYFIKLILDYANGEFLLLPSLVGIAHPTTTSIIHE